ncbi:hypothetical protein TorRG33x02_234160 [Trema orientale]|uniref:Uncharacterized protein n=1 Tax=Trema orientale TaxID=63057 RepID=A0A2P5E4E8_TREOI|nr:hypothetical protein TorRG33x02_234160 [Trema orientale]
MKNTGGWIWGGLMVVVGIAQNWGLLGGGDCRFVAGFLIECHDLVTRSVVLGFNTPTRQQIWCRFALRHFWFWWAARQTFVPVCYSLGSLLEIVHWRLWLAGWLAEQEKARFHE